MLQLMANENIPRLLVERLRGRGHDVRWIREGKRGISDPTVLASAMNEGRILLTCDKDFGELVFRQGKLATCGIILIRLVTRSQTEFADKVVPLLEGDDQRWLGHFSVIDSKRIRIVPLPGGTP